MFATQKPATLIWCMGADPAHRRHRQRARELASRCCSPATSAARALGANIFRGHDNVQGATDVGLDIDDAAVLLRPGRRRLEALVARLGGRLRAGCSRASTPSRSWRRPASRSRRWFDARAAAEGPGRPERQCARDVRARATPATPSRRIPESMEGNGEARTAGGRRSASDHLGFALGRGRPQGRHLSAAGLHPVRKLRLACRLEPLAAMGRADRQAAVRDRRTTIRSCI